MGTLSITEKQLQSTVSMAANALLERNWPAHAKHTRGFYVEVLMRGSEALGAIRAGANDPMYDDDYLSNAVQLTTELAAIDTTRVVGRMLGHLEDE